jgi:hypothetical protein
VKNGWGGAPPIKSITNIPLGDTYELNEDPEDMIKVAALLSVNFWSFIKGLALILKLVP